MFVSSSHLLIHPFVLSSVTLADSLVNGKENLIATSSNFLMALDTLQYGELAEASVFIRAFSHHQLKSFGVVGFFCMCS